MIDLEAIRKRRVVEPSDMDDLLAEVERLDRGVLAEVNRRLNGELEARQAQVATLKALLGRLPEYAAAVWDKAAWESGEGYGKDGEAVAQAFEAEVAAALKP